MNLRLYASKREDVSDYSQGHYIRFSIVDLDISQNYPANFVCMLPKHMGTNGKSSNVFSTRFGSNSVELAKRLLKEALKTEDDSEVKAEIENRLQLLEPKPPVLAKCRSCGKMFELEKRRFKPKTCPECRQKRRISQE
jgi:predicted Zn-ribbon and HTH transcriptional regulator